MRLDRGQSKSQAFGYPYDNNQSKGSDLPDSCWSELLVGKQDVLSPFLMAKELSPASFSIVNGVVMSDSLL